MFLEGWAGWCVCVCDKGMERAPLVALRAELCLPDARGSTRPGLSVGFFLLLFLFFNFFFGTVDKALSFSPRSLLCSFPAARQELPQRSRDGGMQ